MLSLLSAAVVNRESALQVGIDPRWAPLAMLVTQDIALKLQFRQQLVLNRSICPTPALWCWLPPIELAGMPDAADGSGSPGHGVGDCRFMVTTTEMRGLQGWFLQRPRVVFR